MTNPMIQEIQVDANGTATSLTREMTNAEFTEHTANQTAIANAKAAAETEEQAFLTDRADGLAKLEAAGLTPAQAKAVARKNR